MKNNFQSFIRNILTGFCIGAANIIPGVSGGTFLLIFGIYERTIKAIGNSVGFCKTLAGVVQDSFKARKVCFDYKKIKSSFIDADLLFLSLIALSALFSIFVLSGLMKFLLENHYACTYAFFAGLITASLYLPFRMIKKFSVFSFIIFTAALILTIYITAAVNPADKLLKKSAIYEKRIASSVVDVKEEANKSFSYTGVYSFGDYSYGFICGAIAISAMVLPGLSGSLVLILMGEYFVIINAISSLRLLYIDHFIYLSVVALGMLIGIVCFAKVVEYFFTRFVDYTLSFLGGLMAGSLYALWPFKKYLMADIYLKKNGVITLVKGHSFITNINIMPESLKVSLTVTGVYLLGLALMLLMLRFEKKN